MQRLARLVAACAAAALTVATAAMADKPDRTPSQVDPPVTFPAGDVCPFELTLAELVDRSILTTHYDKAGNVRWEHSAGAVALRFTNESNGRSVDLNISGPGKITTGADGLVHIDATGLWALILFPTDSPASTALYIKGHTHFTIDPNAGTLTLVSYKGTAKSICDMID